MTDALAEAASTDPSAEPAASRWRGLRRWRPPAAWRTRRDWLPIDTTAGQIVRGVRWGALAVYLAAVCYIWDRDGIPFDRTSLLIWIAGLLGVLCIGRHPVWLLYVVADFAPFAAVLLVYDNLRGWSYKLGMPTWWHPQVDLDRVIGFGTAPTLWLQEHLKRAYWDGHRYEHVQWYDVIVSVCYYSFFFLPYLVAGVMWLRSRTDFYRWALRFVGLSFFAFAFFVLMPTAPPWAAARCTAAQVANHPNNPVCMGYAYAPDGGILGRFVPHHTGTNPFVEQTIPYGFNWLHLDVANDLLDTGRAHANAVAAIPSLHCGGTVLFVLFMWGRVRKGWKPVLALYPFLMCFSLVYAGEHYVTDCIAGALSAWLIHTLATRVERRWRNRRGSGARSLATLKAPPPATQEITCPPTATTPSSTSASDAASSSPPARSTAAPVRPGTTDRSASS